MGPCLVGTKRAVGENTGGKKEKMGPKEETREAARERDGWRESVRSQVLRHLCALKPESSHFDSDPRSSGAHL